jgi:hypothetical protein
MFNADNTKPRKNKYSKGFEKAYLAYNHKVAKHESFMEWKRQDLESSSDYIAQRAFAYYLWCQQTNRFMMDFRRWLHNQGWEDVYPTETIKIDTPEEAVKQFKQGKWNQCDGIDCRDLRIKWNTDALFIGDAKIILTKDVRDSIFALIG